MNALFRVALRRLRNGLKQLGFKKSVLFTTFGLVLLALLTFIFFKVFSFLYHQPEFPDYFKLFLSEKILMMVFLTMFVMQILSALISTLNIFFLSRDLNLLLSSPLPVSRIFAWKGMEVAVNSSAMVLFFSLPMMFAYCTYFTPRAAQIAAVLVVFFLFIAAGVLVGVLIGFVVPAFVSVKKLQPALSLVSILLISCIVIFLRLLRPEQFANPEIITNLLEYMGGLKVSGFGFFPFYWAARAFGAAAAGETAVLWNYIGAFVLLGSFLAGLLWLLQKKMYLRLFDKLKKSQATAVHRRWKWKESDGGYGSLWKKEVKTFLRTPAQWSQLLIVAAIVIVFIINMKEIPLPMPSVKTFLAFVNLGMAALVVVGLGSRFAFTSLPMEHPGIVHVLASPFDRMRVFRFKLVFYLIPHVVLGFLLFFTGDIALGLDPFMRLSGVVFLLPALPLITVLALYFSLNLRDSIPLSPQHLIVTRPGILFMLWSLVYVVASLVYFVRPLFVYYYNRYVLQPVPAVEIIAWFTGFFILNALLIVYFIKRSLRLWRLREFL